VKFWVMNHLVNPLVRALLRSPAHRLLSGSLVVLTYTGRKSGRRHSLPVMYAERDGELVVFAGRPHEKRWWRNLRGGARVGVVLRRRRLEAYGEAVLDEPTASEAAWALYAAKFPKAASARRPGDEAVFVRIELAEEGKERA
jgi:deazaflavin-dependent oxidoreductase (nitroreductase family)